MYVLHIRIMGMLQNHLTVLKKELWLVLEYLQNGVKKTYLIFNIYKKIWH